MGCDIHWVVERRVRREDNLLPDQWVAVRIAIEDNERNYRRFAALAGVRGHGPAPRGLPVDASDTSRLLFNLQTDRHSPSWLPLADAVAIFSRTDLVDMGESSPTTDPEFWHFNIDVNIDGSVNDHRIVFWFDN